MIVVRTVFTCSICYTPFGYIILAFYLQLLRDSTSRHREISFAAYCTQLFNLDRLEAPTPVSTFVAQTQIVLLSFFCVCLAAVLVGIEAFSQSHLFVPVVIVISCIIGKLDT